jgi:hypothetical protein
MLRPCSCSLLSVTFTVVQAHESGFRQLYFGAHKFGIHLAAGPDLMHLMLEGLANTLVKCTWKTLKDLGVLGDINKLLADMHIRSHDEFVSFTWVRTGLQSLTMVSAEDTPGVLNSLVLALGVYTRDDKLSLKDLAGIQRALYLFGCLYRNMKMQDHTEDELDDLARLIVMFEGTLLQLAL